MNRRSLSIFFFSALMGSAATSGAQVLTPDGGLVAWQRDFGPGWTVWPNANGTPHRVFGPGALIAAEPVRRVEEARAAAARILAAHGDWFGVASADLKEVIAAEGRAVIWLQYQQMHRGVPVHEAFVDFRFNALDGRLAMAGSDAQRGLRIDTVPALEAARAIAIFKEKTAFRDGSDVMEGPPELEVHPDSEGLFRLVWAVTGEIVGFQTKPTLFIDARTGEVIDRRENIHHADLKGNVKGNVTPGALPDTASNPPQLTALKGVRVNVPGIGFAFTDGNGDFSIPYSGTTPQNVTINLTSGQFWTVTDASATAIVSASGVLDPMGSPTPFVLNGTPSQFTTAQANGAHYTQAIHDYVKGIVPSMPIDTVITVNVNINQSCNAYFSGNSINFYRVAGNCNNTAYSSVVAHEYGHNTDSRAGGIRNSGISEGIGDIHSIYLLNDPVVGRFFTTSGGAVRDAQNTYTWPIVTVGHQEVHLQGQVFMGFAYDFLRSCQAAYGSAPGYAIAETAMFESFLGNAGFYPDSVLEVLIADDDDSNLNNGTPHIDAFHAAALKRHFIRDVFQAIGFAHTPVADTAQTAGSYAVSVVPTAKVGSITGVSLFYSTGGPFTQATMTPSTGGSYLGAIPALQGPAVVRYYVQATNSLGNVARLPRENNSSFAFAVGSKKILHSNGFEAGAGGWVTRAVSGTNNWRIGAPLGRDFDPVSAASGTNCYRTDASTTNEKYSATGVMQLDSPSIDCSSETGVRLRFRRWLTVDRGDFGVVLVNGNQVYINSATAGVDDQDWTVQDLDISAYADRQASVVVRFELRASNTNSSYADETGGWNVDDVEIYALGAAGCSAPSPYGTASNCSGSFAPSLATSGGDPRIGNASFQYDVAQAPGGSVLLWIVGTRRVNLPTPGGALLVDPLLLITSTASGSGPGSGSGSLPMSVPNDPSIVGAEVNAQVIPFDTSVSAGYCVSKGVSLVICPP